MHVSGIYVDLNWFLQLIGTAFVIALGLLYLVKNAASKYFVVDDANFDSNDNNFSSHSASSSSSNNNNNNNNNHQSDHNRKMPGFIANGDDACIVCRNLTTKQCSGCKLVRYCSEACQASHWKSGHKTKCKDFQSGKMNSLQSGRKGSTTVALAPASGTSKSLKQLKKILFPYEDFVELFNWNKPGFPPCGLLNCGNSCFANVVLQCLAYTRPLVAYLLERGHRKECRRNDWCFLCELQTHVERASKSLNPFSPINVLSRLPNIGGNLGYGKQEDAHEFMRFAIDTMQSVCLDEFGGEKALHPSSQETTLIQHIFGGHLQSQVVCTKCDNVSNQYENMMDLTVEIQGDAASLEECLDQFTVRERLHGDNMYKCDGCNDYVLAWKRLTIRRAPNILTIALKRFQSGRFGKLNKRVTFPETLDLKLYMSEPGDGNDIYKLYAVVVHVDMLNASFFGHYICYTKDFCGSWYRIDDCKVTSVELDEVLSQGAYMLLYSRVCARPSCLKAIEPLRKEEHIVNLPQEVDPGHTQLVELSTPESINPTGGISGSLPSDSSQQAEVTSCEKEKDLSSKTSSENVREDLEMVDDSGEDTSLTRDIEVHASGYSNSAEVTTSCSVEHAHEVVSRAISPGTKKHTPETHFLNNGESSFLDSGVEDGDRVDEYIGTKKLPNQNGVSDKGAMCLDTSVAGSGSDGRVMNEMISLDYRSRLEKVFVSPKTIMLLPFSTTEDDAETGKVAIMTQNSSGATLKPLFPPGFLGKRPHRKISKIDAKGLSENGKLTSVCNHIDVSNGFAKPCFTRYQSGGGGCGGEEKDVGGESLSNFDISSPAISFVEQAGGKCGKEEDDCFLSGSIISLCNGNANAPNLSDENFSSIIKTDDRRLVRKTFSYDAGFHGLSETIAYGESEREDQIPNDREPGSLLF